MGMKKLLIMAAGVGALALAGCDVNVTSNDAATQQAINQAQDTLGDIGQSAVGFRPPRRRSAS
jgi:outer membrane murein-binding lipoprotein Lpp